MFEQLIPASLHFPFYIACGDKRCFKTLYDAKSLVVYIYFFLSGLAIAKKVTPNSKMQIAYFENDSIVPSISIA